MNVAWFVPIGFLVGTYGTLIGAGGGFILVPLLVFLFPHDSPSMITAASLAVICVNATSGTIAYARMKRISYKTGVMFALATIPGAVIGSWLTRFIPRKAFGALFGTLLVGVAVFITLTRGMGKRQGAGGRAADAGGVPAPRLVDTVVDREGRSYPLSYDMRVGMLISFLVGCFSSLVGIGGGLIHVPVMTYVFDFPVHIATATSHFVLVFTSLAGVVEHLIDHSWPVHPLRDACLAAGIVAGAQLGAFFSRKVSSAWIVIGLAVALGLVGVRLLLTAVL
jgi:uncharacterized membrane protein YfcA